MKKKLLSWLLALALIAGVFPLAGVQAMAAEVSTALAGAETIGDEYITASVSKQNGGFTVTTAEGDRLNKKDNNVPLLYHDGRYDTSFLSFRVGEEGSYEDYLFGGSYPDQGSTAVTVTRDPSGRFISAVWGLENLGLTFTQTLELVNETASEHGMISISVKVESTSATPIKVRARLLLDTYLGSQDYGYYQFASGNTTDTRSKEFELTTVPNQLYAVNDPYSPTVMAYSVHSGSSPYRAVFGHWCSLGSTLFDCTPKTTLNFTDTGSEYLTADSAYALYYDLAEVSAAASGTFSTYYGVYSHRGTPAGDRVAVDLTAPIRLELNEGKTDFVCKPGSPGDAHFSISATFTNIDQENAQPLSNYVLAVTTGKNLRMMSDEGGSLTGQNFDDQSVYSIPYSTTLAVGAAETKVLNLQAQPSDQAAYERVTVGVYDVSETNGQLSDTNKLGEQECYVLLPGTENGVPKVNFAAMTPKIIYTEGSRHLYATVTNQNMLENTTHWNLVAVDEQGRDVKEIPHQNISIKDGVMDVALTDDQTMHTGPWKLELRWTDTAVSAGVVTADKKVQSAPELAFTVSSDPKYKNDTYGVLAVVELDVANSSFKNYRITSFRDEEEFEAYREKNPAQEIIFHFKGNFTVTQKNGTDAVCYTAVSTKSTATDGTTKIENSILINDCLDFEEGTLSVYYESDPEKKTLVQYSSSSAVCVEFDGKLYTNKARTSVWNGKGIFTKLMQGVANYSHVVYDEDGNRGYLTKIFNNQTQQTELGFEDDPAGFVDTPIYLVWPTLGEIGQTISGMIFNFTYGVLGTMYETDGYGGVEGVVGDVIAFSASLDLTFLQGKVDEDAAEPNTYWNKMKNVWLDHDAYAVPYCAYDVWERTKAAAEADYSDVEEGKDDPNERKVTAAVMVHDVLFGCGEGFVGVNFDVSVVMKNYVAGLPNIEGTISVNTVNNWSYGVEGKIDLEVFTVEAKVSLKSRNNIPVPDELYVFVSGFEPGINIDGLGVIWITGGGGGIENLYDSIFSTKAVPPLKLLISVSFDILKVMECEKATLSLGLTGISLQAENIGVKAVPGLTAISKMGLAFEWYPGIDLRANIAVNLMAGVIRGGGYIVLISPDYKDVFFEMFARCQLCVPESIPFVGGMQLAGVDLGISTEKIWGAVEVLCITLGITYYWGQGQVDFGSGNKSQPTFPDLLGYDDIPIAYDAEGNRTLYARIGTNTVLMADNLADDGALRLMNTTGAWLKSDLVNKSTHRFNLGSAPASGGAIVQITYDAVSLADAEAKAQSIRVCSPENENDQLPLLRYEQTVSAAGEVTSTNWQIANAHLSFAPEERGGELGKATFAFTVTKAEDYGKEWKLTTPAGSDVLLYNVTEPPKLTEVSAAREDSGLKLAWQGDSLEDLDQISFFLCASTDPADPGYRLGVVEERSELGGKNKTLTIPADVPSGTYYLRAVYSKTDEINGVIFSSTTVQWTNPATPHMAQPQVRAVGNLQFELTLDPTDQADGYLVSVYDGEGNVTDFDQVSYEKAETGSTVLRVGGRFTAFTENQQSREAGTAFGLEGGKAYSIGVTPYKAVSLGTGQSALKGEEVRTSLCTLPEMRTPTVTFTPTVTPQSRTETVYGEYNQMIDQVNIPVFTTNTFGVQASFSQPVTGTWQLDAGESVARSFRGSFTSASTMTMDLSQLTEGSHTLTVEGAAATGDSFQASYVFTVDTLPPQLLLEEPVNGGFYFADGRVTFTGIADGSALFTIRQEGRTLVEARAVEELAGPNFNATNQRFSFELMLDDPNSTSQKNIEYFLSDDVGNTTSAETLQLTHGGLAKLKELVVEVDGLTHASGNVPVPATGLTRIPLSLRGIIDQEDETDFCITGDNVTWEVRTVSGQATLEEGNLLTVSPMSQGTITGKLAVSDTAFRTATLCFGARAGSTVALTSTVGGTVSGGGTYSPGDTVTLTATPASGYRFAGWALTGITVADPSSTTITFLMPQQGNVQAQATFVPLSTTGSSPSTARYATAGTLVSTPLPPNVPPDNYLPYYRDENGNAVFVPLAAAVDGQMCFLAPRSETYYFGPNSVEFGDLSGHWAAENILFCARRGIFQGVGEGRFLPDETMSRAMLATVLYRLSGTSGKTSKTSDTNAFSDVEKGSWYEEAVLWGAENGIITGYGDGRFGPNDPVSREQISVMLLRFAEYMGFELDETVVPQGFADSDTISAWARDGAEFVQKTGLVSGKPGNLFAPQDSATRGENCTILMRMIQALFQATGETRSPAPVTIAFFDTGISLNHLPSQGVAEGENLVFPGRDTVDRMGHGTATASLVLGSEKLGLTGVFPQARVVPLVCCDVSTVGLTSRLDGAGLARAVTLAVDKYGCKILNLSIGLTVDSPELRAAVAYAQSQGVLVVAAVGNDHISAPDQRYYPAAYENVLGVGAADGDGPAAFSQRNSVDLLAPGVGLLTANYRNAAVTLSQSGTSYACALVSGLAAKLWSENPELTAEQVARKLCGMARDIGPVGYDVDSGWGILEP